ncbi:MAG TPA: hypothetical protein VKN14_10145 [Flavobacteriaceae bacterium]|nr:hypothetical protein [Flavobacteriaceae bacterium]
MKTANQKIADRIDEIQEEMYEIIKEAQKKDSKNKTEFMTYVTAFLINKIATLEIAMEENLGIKK